MSYQKWAEISSDKRAAHGSVILMLEQDLEQGGWYLRGYDREGTETLESWHGSLGGAQAWAGSQFGAETIGAWSDVPDGPGDPVRYALRRR